MNIFAIMKLMRMHQYVKNIFIFAPLFFMMQISDIALLTNTTIAFIAFSLTASAIYILNDYNDIKDDQLHPKKKYRPLASGEISKSQALILMSILSIVGFILMSLVSLEATVVLFIYVIMNISYIFYLKYIAILDIVTIALGFVLRLFVGSAVTEIALSKWIVTMTFLLALFIALAKRRDDVLIYLDTGKKMRKVVDGYNLKFLDTAMSIMSSVVIVAYINYTTSPEVVARVNSQYLYLTAFFVIIGILRYLKIVFILNKSGSPTSILLKDLFIQLILIGWVISFALILY